MFHLMFVHYTFSSVWVAVGVATFWEIAARLAGHVFSLSFVYLFFLFISHFGYKSGIMGALDSAVPSAPNNVPGIK